MDYDVISVPTNAVMTQTRNPLITVAYKKDLKAVRFLIEKCNADINHLSCNNTTAIMFAFQQGNVDVVAYLLTRGASTCTKTLTQTRQMTDFCDADHIYKYMDLLNYVISISNPKGVTSDGNENTSNPAEIVDSHMDTSQLNSTDIMQIDNAQKPTEVEAEFEMVA